jgi:hypothetical protein
MSDNISWENSEHCLLASHQAKDGKEGNARTPTQSADRETLMVSNSRIEGQRPQHTLHRKVQEYPS